MILQGNEDLRIRKTIQGIKSAFEELICDKEYHPMNKELLMEDCMCEPYSNRGPEEHNMRIEMGKKLQD